MSRDRSVYVRHMLLCIERIADYTRDGRDAFFADAKTQDAVVRNLEIIGQVVRDIDLDEFAAAAPSIPWVQVAGLRNVLAHQYLGVDLHLVWNIVEIELPKLGAAVRVMVKDLSE